MNYQGTIIEESLKDKSVLENVKILSTHHYIIFRDKIFYIDQKSKEQYDEAKTYGLSLGIPEYQLDFSPFIKEWER